MNSVIAMPSGRQIGAFVLAAASGVFGLGQLFAWPHAPPALMCFAMCVLFGTAALHPWRLLVFGAPATLLLAGHQFYVLLYIEALHSTRSITTQLCTIFGYDPAGDFRSCLIMDDFLMLLVLVSVPVLVFMSYHFWRTPWKHELLKRQDCDEGAVIALPPADWSTGFWVLNWLVVVCCAVYLTIVATIESENLFSLDTTPLVQLTMILLATSLWRRARLRLLAAPALIFWSLHQLVTAAQIYAERHTNKQPSDRCTVAGFDVRTHHSMCLFVDDIVVFFHCVFAATSAFCAATYFVEWRTAIIRNRHV